MSKLTDELHAWRQLGRTVHALLNGTSDLAAVRDAVLLCDEFRSPDTALENVGLGMGGLGGSLLDSDLALPGTTDKRTDPVSKCPPLKKNGNGRATWLSPYFGPYVTAYGESPSDSAIKRMARTLKRLEIQYPRPEVVKRFSHYCEATDIRFFSVEQFANTFPGWRARRTAAHHKYVPGEVPYQEPGESIDAYIVRLARLGF